MISNTSRLLPASVAAALLAACGGGSGSGSAPTLSTPQSTSMPLLVSDASTEDWATIGVKVLSIALVPQGGGSNVVVYTAPSPAPMVNLAQLDQIGEILGNVSVPVGTYTGAVLTVSGNASDIVLTVSADPEAGFAAPAGTTIAAGQIQVQHTMGGGSSLTVPIDITFESPLVVSAAQSNALDLEFDLGHPAFVVDTCRRARAAPCGPSTSMDRCIVTLCTLSPAWSCVMCTAASSPSRRTIAPSPSPANFPRFRP